MPNKDNNNFGYKFRPRGIEKWHAFAALLSGDEQKETAIEKEQLSFTLYDDYLDEMNYKVQQALSHNSKILVEYLKDNQYQQIQGYISNVDQYNSTIQINDQIIEIDTISFIDIL